MTLQAIKSKSRTYVLAFHCFHGWCGGNLLYEMKKIALENMIHFKYSTPFVLIIACRREKILIQHFGWYCLYHHLPLLYVIKTHNRTKRKTPFFLHNHTAKMLWTVVTIYKIMNYKIYLYISRYPVHLQSVRKLPENLSVIKIIAS